MSFRRTLLSTIALVAPLTAAWTASADSAYLVPAEAGGGDEDVPAELRAAAHNALSEELAGRYTIIDGVGSQAPRSPRLPEEVAGCARTECARRAAELLEADVAAILSLWSLSGSLVVEVAIVEPDGAAFRGSAERGEGSVADAVHRAVEAAFAKRALGPGPWLSVRGSPTGAEFVVEGGPRGFAPDRVALAAGTYDVIVQAVGYETERHRVVVGEGAEDEVVLEVALERESGSGGPVSGGRSVWGLVGGSALTAAGVAALLVGGATLGGGKSELTIGSETFVRRADATAAAVWLGLGGAALIGGVVWLILSVTSDDDGDDSRAVVSPSGITLHF